MLPIYCICCEEMPDRKERASEQFRSLGLDVEMFEGIHARTWGLQSNTLPVGHLGLNLSHWCLWKVLKYRPEQEDAWIIFEDDVIIEGDFPKLVEICLQTLPQDWQVAFLGWYPAPPPSHPSGTHAYMVRRNALDTLLHSNRQVINGIDNSIMLNSYPLLKIYHCVPSMVRQASIERIWDSSLG